MATQTGNSENNAEISQNVLGVLGVTNPNNNQNTPTPTVVVAVSTPIVLYVFVVARPEQAINKIGRISSRVCRIEWTKYKVLYCIIVTPQELLY